MGDSIYSVILHRIFYPACVMGTIRGIDTFGSKSPNLSPPHLFRNACMLTHVQFCISSHDVIYIGEIKFPSAHRQLGRGKTKMLGFTPNVVHDEIVGSQLCYLKFWNIDLGEARQTAISL
jgi:hypothetical protein